MDCQIGKNTIPDCVIMRPAEPDRGAAARENTIADADPLCRFWRPQLFLMGADDERIVAASQDTV